MGNDQHGPAYPEPVERVVFRHPPYECPVCGGDKTSYLRCNRPDCTDGRDPGHPLGRRYFKLDPPPSREIDRAYLGRPQRDYGDIIFTAVIVALIFWSIWPVKG